MECEVTSILFSIKKKNASQFLCIKKILNALNPPILHVTHAIAHKHNLKRNITASIKQHVYTYEYIRTKYNI